MTRITFTLSSRGRVLFVLRGPAPSCEVAARFSVRARRGENSVRFNGRVGRRQLAEGRYRLTARTRGRAPSRPVTVVVGTPPASGGFDCRSSAPPELFTSLLATYSTGSGGSGGSGDATGSSAAGSGPVNEPAANGRKSEEPDSGVLPAVTDRIRKLPEALAKPTIPGDPSSPPWIIGAVALLLVALCLLALLAYVVRFLRGPRTT